MTGPSSLSRFTSSSTTRGSSGGPEHEAHGRERQFETNHLGRFHLERASLLALHAAGKAGVVDVSSGTHRFGRIR